MSSSARLSGGGRRVIRNETEHTPDALLRAQRSPALDAGFRYGWLHPLPCSPGGGQHRQGGARPALLRQTFSESPRQPASDSLCSWPPPSTRMLALLPGSVSTPFLIRPYSVSSESIGHWAANAILDKPR